MQIEMNQMACHEDWKTAVDLLNCNLLADYDLPSDTK